jgi:hypothetical protein
MKVIKNPVHESELQLVTNKASEISDLTTTLNPLYVQVAGGNSAANLIIENDYLDGDITFKVNDGGVDTTVMTLDGATGRVGIGTASPGARLEVSGQVKITGGTPGASKVLTSDADGLATWETPSGGSGGGVTDITYADLVTAIGASTLTAGALYRITDFQTKHYIIDYDFNQWPDVVQIDTLTLTGTSGTANVTGSGGLTKLATFATDLTTTASNFVTAHAAAYSDEGIVVTSSGADLIFTASVSSEGFAHPIITNVTTNLAGTVVNTQAPGIITGPVEPLTVMAISSNELHVEAKSALYPQDIIHYDWNPDHWVIDYSFSDPDGVIIDGFKGVIVFRHDTYTDNYAGGDWRHCKTRRWKTDVPAWSSATAYSTGDIVKYTNSNSTNIYCAVLGGTNHAPDSTSPDNLYWVTMLNLNDGEYWLPSPDSFMNIPAGNDYEDFTLFPSDAVATKGMHFEPRTDDLENGEYWGSLLMNNVFLTDNGNFGCTFGVGACWNTINSSFSRNSLGNNFYANILNTQFISNTIGSDFYQNVMYQTFASNTIGVGFHDNICGINFTSNNISSGMYSNIISNNFGFNAIRAAFCINTCGPNFNRNSVGANFIGCTCGDSWRYNQVADVVLSYVDFTSATHVYTTYNCSIYNDKTAGVRLLYYDNNTATIVAATA